MSDTKVVTGVVKLSYVNVWEPKSINNSEPRYSVSIIIPKTDLKTIEDIKNSIGTAIDENIAVLGGKSLKKETIKIPLRDGDVEKEEEAYQNAYFLNAKSLTPPGIVDRKRNDILDKSEIYRGIYARVSINFYAYNVNGNKGIACGLQNIQKIKDGKPFGNRATAEMDFDIYEDDHEDNFLN